MPLFQQSVQKKFIKDLDKAKVEAAYQKLIAHFGNIDVQENIRKAKEEQYQEGFLRELFVDVLGYVLHPQPNYNLITEQKNEKNSKKADGAILKNGKPIAVIELKSVKTTDLQSIEIQAFNYKNNQTECVYVVTSNFQKIRFYIENAVDFEEFDLFDLSKERFDLLYLCLQVDNVLSDLPLRIKQASLEREENITKKLYADYSLFKQTLFKDISAQNKGLDKLTLFKKTQKLLDRFLFIFFAEDKGLLPPNSVSEILNQWDKLKELDAYQPLYNRFKLFFGYLNYGHKGKHYDIFAYNGGLFAPDDLLDNFIITDNILYNHCRVLSHYDFDTEVDTNILGHIFEHSLNEVDEVAAHTEGVNLEKGKTKRKKDGIFYTPRYITKYIVESTVGELCKQKKLTLGLDNESLIKADTKKDRKLYQVKIDEYRKWLLQLTILDPACGSGAFLNQAFEFLLQEHRLIDSMTAMLFGDSLVMTDNVTEILENNIYGVDINEESVEIARLSLWLRTAKVGRKLNDLSRNIKCGNSLISDPSIAGDLAFDWEAAFPQVFVEGGFDVVIGNPPYVRQELIKQYSEYLSNNFVSFAGKADLFVYFFEKGINILKEKGMLSFICSGKFFEASYGKELIKFLVENSKFEQVFDFGDFEVFEGVTAYPIIFTTSKKKLENYEFEYQNIKNIKFKEVENAIYSIDFQRISINDFIENDYKFLKNTTSNFLAKLKTNAKSLDELNLLPLVGVKTGFNEGYLTNEKIAKNIKPYVFGRNIKRYGTIEVENNIIFPYFEENSTYKLLEESDEVLLLLKSKEEKLSQRAIIKEGIITGNKKWYEYQQVKKNLIFDNEYIIFPNVSLGNNFTLSKGYVIDMTGFIIPSNSKSLLAILNSSLVKYLMELFAISRRGGYLEYKVQYLQKIPIKSFIEDKEKQVIELVDNVLNSNADFQKQNTRFIKLLQSSFSNLNVNKKIETWYDMKFGEFRKELEKQKIAIPIKELMDYQDLFDTNAAQIKEIQTKINNTERTIDKLVYALYDLTEEEIQIIENQ